MQPSPPTPRIELSSLSVRLIAPLQTYLAGCLTLGAVIAWNSNEALSSLVQGISAGVLVAAAVIQTVRSNRANNHGVARLQEGDPRGALLEFERALALDKGNTAAANNRATLTGMLRPR
jgi:hypothetical protein